MNITKYMIRPLHLTSLSCEDINLMPEPLSIHCLQLNNYIIVKQKNKRALHCTHILQQELEEFM